MNHKSYLVPKIGFGLVIIGLFLLFLYRNFINTGELVSSNMDVTMTGQIQQYEWVKSRANMEYAYCHGGGGYETAMFIPKDKPGKLYKVGFKQAYDIEKLKGEVVTVKGMEIITTQKVREKEGSGCEMSQQGCLNTDFTCYELAVAEIVK